MSEVVKAKSKEKSKGKNPGTDQVKVPVKDSVVKESKVETNLPTSVPVVVAETETKVQEQVQEEKPEPKVYTKELDPIFAAIEEDDNMKRDLFGRINNLRVAPTASKIPDLFIGKDPKPFQISLSAFAHLNEFLACPSDFLLRLPPNLKNDIYNALLQYFPADSKATIKLKDRFVRGIIPVGKPVLTNKKVVKSILEILPENILLDSWNLTDESLHIRVILTDMDGLYVGEERTKGFFPGLHFSTTEMGTNSLKVDFVIWRENGSAIIPVVKKKRFFRATSKNDEGLQIEVQEQLRNLKEKIKPFVDYSTAKISELVGKKLDQKSAESVLENLRKKYKFVSAFSEKTIKRFTDDKGDNLLSLFFSAASVASKLKNIDKRYSLECLIGLFLDSV